MEALNTKHSTSTPHPKPMNNNPDVRWILLGLGLGLLIMFAIVSLLPDGIKNPLVGLLILLATVAVVLYIIYLRKKEERQRLESLQKNYQINQERQQLLALINNIADAVLVVDQAGKVGLFNDATAKLLGSQYALVGKPLSEVFKLLDENDTEIDLSSIDSSSPVRRRDLKVNLPDSSTINVEADISPYIVNQQHHGFIILMRDITKERTVEQQQAEFISVASHELRTPLAIAEANISTSLASPNAPTDLNVRNMLTQAHNNIVFLSNIINDLTTLSKAERDELKVDPDMLDPADLLSEIQREFTDRVREKGLELKLDIAKDVRTTSTSRYRVKQIIQNFLTNAIKYSREGSVTIGVANAPNKDALVFSVKDTGLGISVSDQKKLFTKFFRSEDYETRQSGGSGLGLYISATLAHRLGGRVWCESVLKQGSTFFLEIPPYKKRPGEK